MISQLHRLLRPFMLRRLKVDVANLPPKKETVLYVPMTEVCAHERCLQLWQCRCTDVRACVPAVPA